MDRIAERARARPGRAAAAQRAARRATRRRPARCCARASARAARPSLRARRSSARGYRAAARRDRRAGRRRRRVRRGIGLALVFHGGGFTGSGEVRLASRAALELTRGRARACWPPTTEIGQGAHRVRADRRRRARRGRSTRSRSRAGHRAGARQRPDRGLAHHHGGRAGCSQRCACGRSMRERRSGRASARGEYLRSATAPLRVERTHTSQPPGIEWDDETYRGDAYGTLRLGLRRRRGRGRPRHRRGAAARDHRGDDIGRAIHPLLAAGQIEGGTLQGARLGAARGGA